MRRALLIASLGLLLGSVSSFGAALSPEERAFFDKHLSSIVEIEPTRVSNPAVDRVFSAPIYDIKIIIHQGQGTQSSHVTVARVGSDLIEMSNPGTNAELPNVRKLISPKFKLKTDADGQALQIAIDAIDPIRFHGDEKDKAVRHQGNEWTLIRGSFFKKHSGYVFTTDASGQITGVRYSLDIP